MKAPAVDALNIINNKLILFSEVVVCLFENCNLSCVFCPQNHSSSLGMSREEIMSKVPQIARYINSQTDKDVHIHVMGGELFQDHLVDNGFLDIYTDFIQEIYKAVDGSSRHVLFNFISNFVFTRQKAVKDFLDKHNLKISVSYDIAGRFSASALVHFEKNLDYFKDSIRMVSCVLTKQNMSRLQAGDRLFDKIYSQFPVDWDSLIPALENSPMLMPSESELLTFYKFLVDRYPECINLANFFEPGHFKQMRCTRGRSLTLMPDNSIPLGCSGTLYLKDSHSKNPGSNEIVENFLNKYSCLSCDYYSRCPFTCFIKQDYGKLVHDLNECVYKETFRYIEEKTNEGSYESYCK